MKFYRRDRTKNLHLRERPAVRDATGTILYYEGSIEDITHRKRVEEIERQTSQE